MRTLVYSDRYECDIGEHVFLTGKYRRVVDALCPPGAEPQWRILVPEPVDRALLELVHTPAYLDDFLGLRSTPRVLLSELPISAEIRDAYVLAAGGTLQAAERALEDGAAMHIGGGFHHAFPDHGEGFCVLKDVAVAARKMIAEGLAGRVMVIDCDVHQGNGTAAALAGFPDIYTFSIHQMDIYPSEKPPEDQFFPEVLRQSVETGGRRGLPCLPVDN